MFITLWRQNNEQQTPAAVRERKRVDLRDNCEHLVLNEAQWLNLELFAACESDTSSLLEILLRLSQMKAGQASRGFHILTCKFGDDRVLLPASIINDSLLSPAC